MQEWLSVFILAIVQGITEWLPISSSAHLVLASKLLEFAPSLQLIVALHFGTLMAVFVYFGREITDILRDFLSGKWKTENGKLALYLLIAAVPAGVLGYFLHDFFDKSFTHTGLIALGLLITSILLFIGGNVPVRKKEKALTWKIALLIGLAQCLSLFRGVSRSGSTIVSGLGMGLSEKQAVRFSFLLSIPVILGANILTLGGERLSSSVIWPALLSFFVGLCFIHISFTRILNDRKHFKWLGWYVLIIALLTGFSLIF